MLQSALWRAFKADLEQGNSAQFMVGFFDAAGVTSIPSSASMTVAYINTANSSQTDIVALNLGNKTFIGTWSSTSASLGLATWTAIANSSVGQVKQGLLRIIQRKGSS